ncbi:MAG: bifunctional hydroxymethylpyrimidine kinase/phosphomethylpyrimidine kinase [Vagococcus sp.]|uniref:bifunctional hydroxymethylpyrimidine kinase/phosphomethylpyrimidine kinase n=1 Tax=Vagococcus sp. TaxID=1933889 RepID=UPI002FC8CF85
MVKKVLSINYSDTNGISGIQKDLVTFQEQNVFGFTAITKLLINSNHTKEIIETYPSSLLKNQLESVLAGGEMDAVKIGHFNDLNDLEVILSFIQQKKFKQIVLDVSFVKDNSNLFKEIQSKLMPTINALVITPTLLAQLTGETATASPKSLDSMARKLLTDTLKYILISLNPDDNLHAIVTHDSLTKKKFAKHDAATILTAKLA